ncbi:hypothetical protein Taro_036843, partial [Colocasia esculenta]|nr:hypothetical protein [Colocasia esculenta]
IILVVEDAQRAGAAHNVVARGLARVRGAPVGVPQMLANCSVSLDYANHWRSQHAESACHDDRKSCSTQREISSPDLFPRSQIWVHEHRRYSHPLLFIPTPSAKELGITFRPGIGIAHATTIRNRHSEAVDRALVLQNFILGPKFRRRARVLVHRLSYPLGRTRIFLWLHEHRRYSHPLRFIPTPSAKELGITFRLSIGIAHATTIRNRHSETVDRVLVSRNSIPGLEFRRGACLLVHQLSYPMGRTQIFVRPGIETPCEAPIRNRHFD